MYDETETRTLASSVVFGDRDGEQGDGSGVLKRGSTLDRYVILHCLGIGGMGVVYAAWDSELDRKVALKLLRPGWRDDDPQRAHTWLLAEAQALARLSHPNVVAVYDTGTYEGRVFLVMELVEGRTLSEWLTQERSWQEVVVKFRDVARGLAAVHGAGLVHRDVKPGNVIVGADGRVRVVDLGLARVPSRRATPQGGSRAGTPVFMAPEQRHSLVADARSDQFSFCASLFYALYGEMPFGTGTSAEMQARIERGDVARPPGRRVPGSLRQVVVRGLKANPEDRHASMDALAADLERISRVRQRGGYTALMVTGLLVVLALFVQQWQVQAALVCQGAEGKLAGVWDTERRDALRDVFLAVDQPYASRAWNHFEAGLERYLAAWTDMHVEVCEATRLRREQSESLMDLRMACLGERLDEVAAMNDLLSTADAGLVARSASLLTSLTSLDHCADVATLAALSPLPDEARRAGLEEVRARVARGKALIDAGRAADAVPVLEAASRDARVAAYRPLEAYTLLRLAEAHGRQGNVQRMEELLFEALAAAMEGGAQREAAWARLDLVIVGWMDGRYDMAERWARLAHASIRHLGDTELEALWRHRLGMLNNRQARYETAIEHFQAAIELKKKVYDPDDPRIGYSISNMGIAYRHLGRYEEALASFRAGLALIEQAYGPEHPDAASMLSNIALAHHHNDRPQPAREHFLRALAIQEKVLGPAHPDLAYTLEGLGEVHIELGEAKQAVHVLERALDLRTGNHADPLHVASTQFNLARALVLSQGPAAEAGARARQLAREARRSLIGLGPRASETLRQVESWLTDNREAI